MRQKLGKTLAGLGMLGAIVFGLAWTMPAPARAAAPQQGTAMQLTAQAQRPGGREAEGKRLTASLIKATVEATGLERAAVIDALKGGQSLAQIAAANGSSSDAVLKVVQDKAKARLDNAVAKGRLSQARADELLAQLVTKAGEIMNDATLGQRIAERQERASDRRVLPALVRAAAAVTGLPVGDITGRLRDGESLTAIVTSAGGNIGDVVDAATAEFRAAAEEAVK